MKKEKKQKRGEILCKLTKEEVASFKRLDDTRQGIMSLVRNLALTEKDLWDALREKYELKNEPRMVIDSEKLVVRKIF